MITLTLLNIAWQSLLLSMLGWMLVTWCIRDARRRAWTAALALMVTTLGPFVLLLHPHHKEAGPLPLAPAPAWKPDWKVKFTPPTPAMLLPDISAKPASDAMIFARQGQHLWIAGFLLFCLVHGVKTLIAWRWRMKLKPVPNRQVSVFTGAGSPCVVGVIRPVIAVPEAELATLTDDQWRWLLAHEREHLRGHDAAVAWIFGWLRAWLWWNPFVHFTISEWAQAREEVCDAVAVAGTDDSESYANFLLGIASRHPMTAAFSMAASRPARRLRARLQAVLNGRHVRDRVGLKFMTLAAVTVAGGVAMVSCSGVEEGAIVQPKMIHVYSVFVEPAEFKAHVVKMLNEGGSLISPKTVDMLDKASQAELKNVRGETVHIIKNGEESVVDYELTVAPDLVARLGGKGSVKEALQNHGIAFPLGTQAVLNASKTLLTIRQTELVAQHIIAIVRSALEPGPQVYLQTRLIEAPTLFGQDRKIYNADEYRALDRSAAQKKGVDLLSAPSVTTKMGVRATVEVSQERPGHPDDFVGIRFDVLPTIAADGVVELTSGITLAQEEGANFPPHNTGIEHQGHSIDWAKVKRWEKQFAIELKHQQSGVVHVGETKKGRYVTLIVTASAINSKGGMPQDGFGPKPRSAFRVKGPLRAVGTVPVDTAVQAKAGEAKRVSLKANVVKGDWQAVAPMPLGKASRLDVNDESDDFGEQFLKGVFEPNGVIQPGTMALSGVLTDPQFERVLRALTQKKGMQLVVLPNGTVESGKHLPLKSVDRMYEVTPTLGPDGNTIDLLVSNSAVKAVTGQPITTSVTVWDGQTIVMGELVSEDKGKALNHWRLLFVTAKIIAPMGGEKKVLFVTAKIIEPMGGEKKVK